MVTTRQAIYSPISLHGRRVVLRTMTEQDYDGWLRGARTMSRLAVEVGAAFGARRRTSPKTSEVSSAAAPFVSANDRWAPASASASSSRVASSARSRCRRSSADRCSRPTSATGSTRRWPVSGLMPEAVVTMLQYAFESLAPAPHRDQHHPEQRAVASRGREARTALRGHRRALPRDRRRVGGPRALRHHRRGVERPGARTGRQLVVAGRRLDRFVVSVLGIRRSSRGAQTPLQCGRDAEPAQGTIARQDEQGDA